MIRQFELVDIVRAYNPNADEALLNRAYVFGVKAHGEQTRANGEPYFNHPVEVAAILTDLKLDDATIVTALLHDTIEDTVVTYQELVESFGAEIADLVNGVTKLTKLSLRSKEAAQAENLRKLLVAMARDPRVLLVKMADRLHNMRTIQHLRPDKQKRIARETLDIFAPLAGRMGMQKMREELEDISFSVLNPEARLSIMKHFVHLKQLHEREHGEGAVPRFAGEIKSLLEKAGLEAQVTGREKRPYSIWRKMQSKHMGFEQLSDIIGFRVILADQAQCYQALGAIHQAWPAMPGRFKDYISRPKRNGYRSIHSTVFGASGARIEVQIRTHQMHEVAETGVAAHWSYKDGRRNDNSFAVDPYSWLRNLVERMEQGESASEEPGAFMEDAKRELSFDQVYCYSPKGKVIDLQDGATALDFAYAIHTDLGHRAVGAKINGMRAPLWAELRNGQTIEILQSEGQTPDPMWENMVKTPKARHAIRRTLRLQENAHKAEFGMKLLEGVFERAETPFTPKALEIAAHKMGEPDGDSVLAKIFDGEITAMQVFVTVYPEHPFNEAQSAPSPADPNRRRVVAARSGGRGKDLSIPPATCCRPLPGERIVALREPQVGYRLHSIDCETLAKYEDAMDRWLSVEWAPEAADAPDHIASLALLLLNEPGALGQVCTLIGQSGANIDHMSFVDRKPDYYKLVIDLAVRDLRHLNNVMTSLSAQTIVTEARRLRGARPADRPHVPPVGAKEIDLKGDRNVERAAQ